MTMRKLDSEVETDLAEFERYIDLHEKDTDKATEKKIFVRGQVSRLPFKSLQMEIVHAAMGAARTRYE